MPDAPLPDDNWSLGYLISGALAVIGTLATAVGILYRSIETRNKVEIDFIKQRYESELTSLKEHVAKCDDAREECEQDRLRMAGEISVVQEKISQVQNQMVEFEKVLKNDIGKNRSSN